MTKSVSPSAAVTSVDHCAPSPAWNEGATSMAGKGWTWSMSFQDLRKTPSFFCLAAAGHPWMEVRRTHEVTGSEFATSRVLISGRAFFCLIWILGWIPSQERLAGGRWIPAKTESLEVDLGAATCPAPTRPSPSPTAERTSVPPPRSFPWPRAHVSK